MYYEVIFYIDHRGRSPVKEFLDELQTRASTQKDARQLFSKIFLYIEILEKTGSRSGLPYTKYIGDGIWELRPSNYRIFFFIWNGNHIVLLHPFQKKTKKTPSRQIQQAKKEKNDWVQNGHKRLSENN